jgi:hypothetical protein
MALQLAVSNSGEGAFGGMMSAPPQTMSMDHEHSGEHGSHAGMA